MLYTNNACGAVRKTHPAELLIYLNVNQVDLEMN